VQTDIGTRRGDEHRVFGTGCDEYVYRRAAAPGAP
jgi:hypothetical protein